MDIQAMFNAMSAMGKSTRSGYHLTLGRLIAALKNADPALLVEADCGGTVDRFTSYRGYYEDLAITPSDAPITVGELLKKANEANGREFNGYKGGDFLMDNATPLWIAPYGSSGNSAIIDAKVEDGKFILITKQTAD